MKSKSKEIVFVVVGLLLVAVGFLMLRGMPEAWGGPLPYLCLGIGAGAFGWGSGELLKQRALKGDPKLEKQLEVAALDERNVALANRAKARAFDCMLYIFGALMLAFALMKADLVFILLLVGAYLLVVGISVYYYIRYDKEM
ncbi:hypothetical protein H6B15_00230 [Gemmiger formicilis]|uniref:hypothetical protein n=1 Tax=Gemmiger formicilis TaxID=745368 RepID=UPI0019594B5F|nr:hypothetical protein [Gemmiger formicilis]MBM6715094.1 hypothetical protein [Gemmiger formicilis]